MTREKSSKICQHNILARECKDCRRIYNTKAVSNIRARQYEVLNKIPCEACGYDHPYAKEVHHLATEYKRYGRSQDIRYNLEDLESGKAILLCPTCHVIFHGVHGGKNQPFPLYSKETTIEIIMKARNLK